MYTILQVEDAIENALRDLYSYDDVPKIPRSAMKSRLRPPVTNVHLKCNKICYIQTDGLTMGGPLAVILANLWIKPFEKSL